VSRLDSNGNVGRSPSLAFNSAGRPAISYHDKTNLDLDFISFNGTKWTKKVLDATSDSGRYSDLAYNKSKDIFAVAYERSTGGLFRYIAQTSSAGNWGAAVTVDDTTGGGGHISLAFDKYNRPAFSYYDMSKADLKFARFNGSAWKTTTIASSGTVGMWSTLAFVADGHADVLYYKSTSDALYSAHGDIGAWTIKSVAGSAGFGATAGIDPTTGKGIYSWIDSVTHMVIFGTRVI
jgi:hypothetical protein